MYHVKIIYIQRTKVTHWKTYFTSHKKYLRTEVGDITSVIVFEHHGLGGTAHFGSI